ncbi:transporter family-2 protein [Peptoclostridium litorale DSM 5388]|uniref:Putative membrane protein n=1 Tax=Peptoclostridium litorale DSM 5388 TaxID=1121324 RepID=A0A069RNA1_PEPLI|nr:DMT family transporter [Peptoclostridium litorale]KDR95637.1 putative membrane protein [Peptoclostridium litorale DSM 5388]SIN99953.1 transporter family-2 protein [Peptoclostridium litorale DSM 5388]
MLFVYILISILAGVSVVVSRIINSNLAEKIGILQGTFFNFILGLICSYVFLFLSGSSVALPMSKMESVPLWVFSGGAAGVLTIVLSNYITPKISAFYLTLLVFIGQLFTGMAIDYFTLGEISSGKIIGGILVLVGLGYNLLVDKNSDSEPAANQNKFFVESNKIV